VKKVLVIRLPGEDSSESWKKIEDLVGSSPNITEKYVVLGVKGTGEEAEFGYFSCIDTTEELNILEESIKKIKREQNG